jgi:hypothetical protein
MVAGIVLTQLKCKTPGVSLDGLAEGFKMERVIMTSSAAAKHIIPAEIVNPRYDPGKDFFPVDIFKTIKSIQAIDRKILPHAEKNLLVSILIHLGENGNIWPNNEQIGKRIGESKDYAKNIIMRLKNKGYLQITGRGKKRKISVIEQKIFGNSQLPKSEIGNSQLPVGNSQLPTEPLPIKRKEKKIIKEKSGAAPDSFNNFHPYLDEIMLTMPDILKGQLSRPFINKCLWDKQGDRPYFNWLFEKCADKDDPAAWVAKGMTAYYAAYLN